MDLSRKEWNFATLNDLHIAANSLLRQAILNERYKRWKKVIHLYGELLWMISLEKFPEDYEPPSSYSLLLYELYFHLGVAYQQVGDDAKAIETFNSTIKVVSIAKNGCLAGCLTNSCLMTPIHARRAFAYGKLGSYKLALKDAEKAVVLDSGSPDVYCIRALVRSTFDDEVLGLQDLNVALKINPNHICSLILKRSFTKPLVARLCQETETYLTCNSFRHPCVLEFYDKLLFPLSVPHTITRVDLTPEKPSKKTLEQLERQRIREKMKIRAQSAIVRPGYRFARLPQSTPIQQLRRPKTAPAGRQCSAVSSLLPMSEETPSACSSVTECISEKLGSLDSQRPNLPRTHSKKKIVIDTPKDYSISVFQAVNIKEAPRMYYKPWSGDKLPVADRAIVNFSPKFY